MSFTTHDRVTVRFAANGLDLYGETGTIAEVHPATIDETGAELTAETYSVELDSGKAPNLNELYRFHAADLAAES